MDLVSASVLPVRYLLLIKVCHLSNKKKVKIFQKLLANVSDMKINISHCNQDASGEV